MPMFATHVGALSMWKGCHDAEAVRCAVFAALLAREGMTGPSKPFEARGGLWDHIGQPKELRLPAAGPGGDMFIQEVMFKRFPAEGSTQAVLELTPAIRQWTKADDIASLHVDFPFGGWQEIADPPKWDPRNRETADHSLPYVISRALIDGDIYLDSFTQDKFMDPVARRLMDKITVSPDPNFTYIGQVRITVRTKAGGELIKETAVRHHTAMTHEEILAKFNRACAFRHVADEQRDRARATWSNLRNVRDIGEPMRALAHFGRPLPL
jgi:2-methylcitrate dehydratase